MNHHDSPAFFIFLAMKERNMSTWQSYLVLSTIAEGLQSSLNAVLLWIVVPVFSIWCLYYGWLLLQYCGRKILSRLVEMREDKETESCCDQAKEEAGRRTAPTVHNHKFWLVVCTLHYISWLI
jgi:hypothetical protein